jgi:hypothetical protein
MNVTTDNLGRRVVIHAGATYFLAAGGLGVVRETFSTSTDRQGRLWRTPVRRFVKSALAARVTELLTTTQGHDAPPTPEN